MAHNLAWGSKRMRALGCRVEELHLVGGAAQSRKLAARWPTCSACARWPLAEPESAALGAALQAAWAVRRAAGERIALDELAQPFVAGAAGVLEPDASVRELHAEGGARFRALVQRSFG